MAWNLRVGEIQSLYLTDSDVWQSIHHFFYHGKNTTTYKHGFFKALLESSVSANNNNEISYDTIFYSFTKMYWNLVIQHQLWQTNTHSQVSSVQKVIQEFAQKNQIPQKWNFEKLSDLQKINLVQQVKIVGKKYVIGATYGDFSGNIYTFDLKQEYLQMHPQFLKTLQTYRRILTNVTNYQLALFLEKFNEPEKVQNLLTKVEFVTNRQSLKEFQLLLEYAGIQHCFYCNRSLKKAVHVDHFIPWSYFQNDLLWNFVLACPTCNTSKSDKLATDLYLDCLIMRNEQLKSISFLQHKFENYNSTKLENLYSYAKNNGLASDWTPSATNF